MKIETGDVSMTGSATTFRAKTQTLPSIPSNAHRIVLMRHGESEFNNANIVSVPVKTSKEWKVLLSSSSILTYPISSLTYFQFTGWCDVALTQRGVVEAVEAGQVFASHEISFRKCYTSLLTRSVITAQRSLEAAGISYTPLQYDWRLNERHYGAFQGLSKEQTVARLGRDKVQKYRRGFTTKPPTMTVEHPHYDLINNDARYRNLKGIPLGESLQDCQIRVVAAFEDIRRDIQTMNNVQVESDYSLIVAHNNTLRALVMHLDDIPVDDIEGLSIPTAIPFYYDVDKTTGRVVSSSDTTADQDASDKIGAGLFRGIYISDERKKTSFLERRRAANDPWRWALHDHQVTESMLVSDDDENNETIEREAMASIVKQAKQNTELFTTKQY